ncbi:DUF3055 domain-containing protein [Effusibacillus lacus]|uniref:Cytosolic protein n=1 Tax=Effusibacillus lacus TaxID=1348429 RepID=A0A292YIS1_9BACL|nr:DUF3055 domain-containing protein [Effusibacillus lacus]TCS74344.1 DUF3055 family protein [Effusibacillus lacus]GAX88801.1 hypothetical protein EFBL_0415 [Effusibacillus lacus]
MDEILFDEVETTRTRHIGFITGGKRFDFTLTNSEHFFGKTIVTCLQSNRSALLDGDDIENIEYLAKFFNLSMEDAQHLSSFLKLPLTNPVRTEQY